MVTLYDDIDVGQHWLLKHSRQLIVMALCCRRVLCHSLNTLRPRQDGRHFADAIFMWILFNENCCILIKISLKYVRKRPIDNNPTLIQIMAWRRSGNKPLSGPMMVRLPTHICVTRPQWVKGNSTLNAHESNHHNGFENYTFKTKATSPGANELRTIDLTIEPWLLS